MGVVKMKLIIDIPEKTVNEIKDNAMFVGTIPSEILWDVTSAIVNGTPLPKGHGDIVDIETLIDMFWDGNSMEITKYDLSVIEPIIKADKVESEE
jgi:hypothetical protein